MKRLQRLFDWLRDKDNRGAVALIFTIFASAVGGAWILLDRFVLDEKPSINSDRDALSVPEEISGSTVYNVLWSGQDFDFRGSFIVTEECSVIGSFEYDKAANSYTNTPADYSAGTLSGSVSGRDIEFAYDATEGSYVYGFGQKGTIREGGRVIEIKQSYKPSVQWDVSPILPPCHG